MTIRHVLLDADGVLQTLPGGWVAAMTPYLGERAEEFLHATWADELPALRGEGDYLVDLARALDDFGVQAPLGELYAAVWHSIEVDPVSIALVHRLRAAGYGVHLGTNQERHRAAYMRTALGYDDLFDVSCYSCDLLVAKPDPTFFERAVRRIGAVAQEVLFVDDHGPNVEGARAAGLLGIRWTIADGHQRLERLLEDVGVRVAARPPGA